MGPDAERFVDYVVTRDATAIEPMRARYVILSNEKGGILNDPVLLRLSRTCSSCGRRWLRCTGRQGGRRALDHPALAAGTTPIRAVHLIELRSAVVALE